MFAVVLLFLLISSTCSSQYTTCSITSCNSLQRGGTCGQASVSFTFPNGTVITDTFYYSVRYDMSFTRCVIVTDEERAYLNAEANPSPYGMFIRRHPVDTSSSVVGWVLTFFFVFLISFIIYIKQ